MPVFDVIIHGKTYRVEVPNPGASPLQVIVDGEAFAVGIHGVEDVAPAAAAAPRPTVAPSPPATPAQAAVVTPPPAQPKAAAQSMAGSKKAITAPMPGTILSLAVSPGQTVEQGQLLCVLEAMKMKNPIRALQAGTIAEIAVQPGQTVAHGTLLLTFAD